MLPQGTACARSPQRVPAPRNVDGTSPPDQRWASADLSPGFSIQIQAWPIHKTRPTSRSELCRRIDNVSSRACEQGPSEVPASPLLPSRLKARLPLRPLSSSLCQITFSFSAEGRLDPQVQLSLPADSPLPFLFSLASKPLLIQRTRHSSFLCCLP